MRLLILFFSGTGNTHYMAGYLAHKLEHLPIEVTVCSIEQTPAEAVPEFDLLTVGFPVYAADSPPFGDMTRLKKGHSSHQDAKSQRILIKPKKNIAPWYL